MIHKINNTIASTQGHCPASTAERGPLYGIKSSFLVSGGALLGVLSLGERVKKSA